MEDLYSHLVTLKLEIRQKKFRCHVRLYNIIVYFYSADGDNCSDTMNSRICPLFLVLIDIVQELLVNSNLNHEVGTTPITYHRTI